jgi:amino acid permease
MADDEQKLKRAPRSDLVEMDQRLKSVEQIVDVVKHVSDQVVDSWGSYLEQKTRQAKVESELSDNQHKRASRALVYVVTLVFVLCIASIFKEEYELAKLIIGSAIAVGAGSGLTTLMRGKKRD